MCDLSPMAFVAVPQVVKYITVYRTSYFAMDLTDANCYEYY